MQRFLEFIEFARRAVNAHPRWASQLNAANLMLLCLLLAPAWITPDIMNGTMTATRAANLQTFSMVTASALTTLFIVRTGFDIWAYHNPRKATDLKYEAISVALVAISAVAAFVVITAVMLLAGPLKTSIFAKHGRFVRADV